MNDFSKRVIKVIQSIPSGKVLSYGRVALLAGSPYAARQVGWLLNTQTEKYNLPWHRIISSKGCISIKDSIANIAQKNLLEEEGVIFDNNKINLDIYMWNVDSLEFFLEDIFM